MVGKRVQFDEETWQAIEAVMSRHGLTFQELTDEAFKDVLKKYKQPFGLMASLRESVDARLKRKGAKRGN
jgi:hypothetical protein